MESKDEDLSETLVIESNSLIEKQTENSNFPVFNLNFEVINQGNISESKGNSHHNNENTKEEDLQEELEEVIDVILELPDGSFDSTQVLFLPF